MKILFTTEALTFGGIEILALRFSEAFGKAGHKVMLYDFEPAHREEELVSKFDQSQFQIVSLDKGTVLNWLIWKTNAALFKTGLVRSGFRKWLIEKHFAALLAEEQFDVICSLTFQQDYLVCKYAPALNIPVVVSMHGIYEAVSPQHPDMAQFVYKRVNAIIYAAEKNMSYYRVQPYFNPALPTHKIYTGTNLDAPVSVTVTRAELGILDDAFLFILVGRGIREKGWQEAIEALRVVRRQYPQAALLFVGKGEFLGQLQQRYSAEAGLFFYGFHPSPVELTPLANVGLLPSYFSAETMPNVIIDYLRCGLPVIATAIGEVPDMLTAEDGQVAGSILPLLPGNTGLEVDTLAAAMQRLIADKKFYQQQQQVALRVRAKFDINTCVAKYLQVFKEAIAAK